MELVFDTCDREQLHSLFKLLDDFGDTLFSVYKVGLCGLVFALPFVKLALRETFLGNDECAETFNRQIFT